MAGRATPKPERPMHGLQRRRHPPSVVTCESLSTLTAMSPFPITSRANPLIKELARLQKRKERTARGTFLIEGAREVEGAVGNGVVIEKLLVAPDLLDGARRVVVDRLRETLQIVEVGEGAFAALSRRQHPDGILAVARSSRHALSDLVLSDDPLLLVAEHIEKPGNLGAMLRTADGAGVDAVIVVDPLTDLENPNVIRASQGSVFSVATAVATSAATMDFLRANHITVIAVTPHGPGELWDLDLTGPVAIAIGNENSGLGEGLLAAGLEARIPMQGMADSLNSSVAAAVALYEVVRQRRAKGIRSNGER